MFVLYLKKVFVIKYILYKNIQMECGEPLYKKVACLRYFYFAALRLVALYNSNNVIGWIIFQVVTS